jgi:hypothetical protein
VKRVAEVALLVSKEVNAKRLEKGLMPRPVRTAVIGYPNVGKSALINRLTKSKACASAPRPGVTRNLRWVRIGGDLDLLDSPGVLPPRLADQKAAARLAMANDIGEASYLASSVAAQLFDEMKQLDRWDDANGTGGKNNGGQHKGSPPSIKSVVEKRFKLGSVTGMTGEDFVAQIGAAQNEHGFEVCLRIQKAMRPELARIRFTPPRPDGSHEDVEAAELLECERLVVSMRDHLVALWTTLPPEIQQSINLGHINEAGS